VNVTRARAARMTCGEKGSVESGAGIWRSKSGWRGGFEERGCAGPASARTLGTARAAVAPPAPLSPAPARRARRARLSSARSAGLSHISESE
jgi:hypothetical protein